MVLLVIIAILSSMVDRMGQTQQTTNPKKDARTAYSVEMFALAILLSVILAHQSGSGDINAIMCNDGSGTPFHWIKLALLTVVFGCTLATAIDLGKS